MDEVLLEAPSSLRGSVEKCSEECLLLDLCLSQERPQVVLLLDSTSYWKKDELV